MRKKQKLQQHLIERFMDKIGSPEEAPLESRAGFHARPQTVRRFLSVAAQRRQQILDRILTD